MGQVVVAPVLPTNRPEAGALAFAKAAAESLSTSEEAVVVAHSASGLFLPVVATLVPTSLMVFLAAAIPVPGMSFLDQLRPDPTVMFNPRWIGQNPVQDDDAALNFLFHDCPPEVASWGLDDEGRLVSTGTLRRAVSAPRLAGRPIGIRAVYGRPNREA